MKEIRVRSPIPVLGAALVWVVWALFLPLHRLWQILIVALISAAAYYLLQRRFPGKIEMVEEKVRKTGDELVDSLLAEKKTYLDELRALNDRIKDEKISSQINRMEAALGKILDFVAEDTKKAPQIRRFMNYYLPTSLKLLRSYDRAASQGVEGENIRNTMRSVENIMETVCLAFERQLDSLFADEALDISTDIVVLEGMLSKEGLK